MEQTNKKKKSENPIVRGKCKHCDKVFTKGHFKFAGMMIISIIIVSVLGMLLIFRDDSNAVKIAFGGVMSGIFLFWSKAPKTRTITNFANIVQSAAEVI